MKAMTYVIYSIVVTAYDDIQVLKISMFESSKLQSVVHMIQITYAKCMAMTYIHHFFKNCLFKTIFDLRPLSSNIPSRLSGNTTPIYDHIWSQSVVIQADVSLYIRRVSRHRIQTLSFPTLNYFPIFLSKIGNCSITNSSGCNTVIPRQYT